MTKDEIATVAAIVQAVFAIAAVGAAIAAIIVARASADAQKKIAEVAIRPWVVINAACEISVPDSDKPLAVRQRLAVIGGTPALDVRTLITAELVSEADVSAWQPRSASASDRADTRTHVLMPGQDVGRAETGNARVMSIADCADLWHGRKVLMIGIAVAYRDVTQGAKDASRETLFIGAYRDNEFRSKQGHVDPAARGIRVT